MRLRGSVAISAGYRVRMAKGNAARGSLTVLDGQGASSRSAASSPSKSSPHGPHARRCSAMPGYRCSAGPPAATSSA